MSELYQDAVHDLNTLIDVSRRMGETFELEPLLRTVEQAVRTALNCDRASIFLYDGPNDELYSLVATGVEALRFSVRLGIAGEAARTREVIHVPDAYADPRFNPAIDRQTGYRTRNLLTLPLIAPGDELIGVLQVLNKLDGDFSPNDLMLARALGSLTGMAIKRQMLLDIAAAKQQMERDLNIARDIQQQLLPEKNPHFDGFDIAGWNKPADQTGGDLYDFLPLDAHRLGFMVADATGHGIGPALIVAQCRALLRATMGAMEDLAQVARRVNDLLHEDLPDDRFVTVCFGVLDARSARIAYTSAGHGPLLLYRAATRRLEQYQATGLPMGIMVDMEIDPGEPLDLELGDMFVLLTDGFLEWSRADGELYGAARLEQLLARESQRPCAELIKAIHEDVLQFAGGTPQLDDLTIVLIRRN